MEQAQGKAAEMVAAVESAAIRVGETFLGETKAFVSDVYAALVADQMIDCDLETFKAWLDRARRRGWLSLSRCDLVEAFSRDKVRLSAIALDPRDATSARHFIRVAA